MQDLMKVKDFQFGSLACDVYGNKKGEFFMTREQIGQALEYDYPTKAIDNLHQRHKNRMDIFSTTLTLGVVEGKRNVNREMMVYNAKGVYEICRWSRQPKADAFYDNVYEILEGLRLGYLTLQKECQSPRWQQTRIESKTYRRMETDEIKLFVEYAKSQGSKSADKYYLNFSRLANKAVGIEPDSRDMATINQLNNLILIENMIGNVISEGMEQHLQYKDIYQMCKSRIEQFKQITYLATA